MRLIVFFLLGFPALIRAGNGHLDAIRSLLLPMRSGQPYTKNRGATPAFTTVKHELLAWIESRLPEMQWNGDRWKPDPVVLQEKLNDQLIQAGLFCDSGTNVPCPQDSELGFVGPIVLDMKPGVLVLRTAVGIQVCGVDESAYAYEWNENHWRRFWQSEQNDYRENKYFPQRLDEVAISPADWTPGSDKSEHLILTMGHLPWCTSVWQDVYYRIWRAKASYPEPALLLEGKEWADIDGPVRGIANSRDALFEYPVSDVEGGSTRPEIRHYLLKNGRLERTDPVALSPWHFTAFWLTDPWPEVEPWTAQDRRSQLREWREQHHGPFAEFSSPTLRCKQHPDQWQVSTYYGENEEQQVYFLIRWRPPYRLTMMAVGEKPWPDCTEEDTEADQPRDLFPGR